MTIKNAIQLLAQKQNLTSTLMQESMLAVMQGKTTPAQIGGFLMGLSQKGETISELTVAAEVMRSLATPFTFSTNHLIDTCGTGGDNQHLFNISTTAAFVVASAGGKVVKHGNRSHSSQSGSADVLESLNVAIEQTPQQIMHSIQHCGIGFLFAPQFHPAVKQVSLPRKELGIRTIFNLLGPLCNPAKPLHQLIGVFDQKWLVPFVEVLKNLGSQHVLVIHGEDGLDEISLNAPTHVTELKNDTIQQYQITPEQFGFARNALVTCRVSSAEESKQKLLSVLHNTPGPERDLVVLNAGAAIYAADLVEDLKTGIAKADECLSTGRAKKTLEQFLRFNAPPQALPGS